MLVKIRREQETEETGEGRHWWRKGISPAVSLVPFVSSSTSMEGWKVESQGYVLPKILGGRRGIGTWKKMEKVWNSQLRTGKEYQLGEQRDSYQDGLLLGSSGTQRMWTGVSVLCDFFFLMPHVCHCCPFMQKNLWQNWVLFIDKLSSLVKKSLGIKY